MLQGEALTTCQTEEVPVGSGGPTEAQRVQLFQNAHKDLIRQIKQAKHGKYHVGLLNLDSQSLSNQSE